MYQGAYAVSVAPSMVSRAREYSNHLVREHRSVGLSFHCRKPVAGSIGGVIGASAAAGISAGSLLGRQDLLDRAEEFQQKINQAQGKIRQFQDKIGSLNKLAISKNPKVYQEQILRGETKTETTTVKRKWPETVLWFDSEADMTTYFKAHPDYDGINAGRTYVDGKQVDPPAPSGNNYLRDSPVGK